MTNNIDLIEFTGDPDPDCSCVASDFADDFVAKTNGTWITSLASSGGESSWSPYAFTIGTSVSTTEAVMTVQGSTNSDAKIEVKSSTDTTTVLPNSITSGVFTSGSGLNLSNTSATIPAATMGGNVVPSVTNTHELGAVGTTWSDVFTNDISVAGTATIATLSLTDATMSGDLVVNGDTTLGNASGDTVTVTATATVAENLTLTGGATLGSNLVLQGNVITGTSGSFNFSTGTVTAAVGTLTAATVADTPSATTDVVRKTDVDIASDMAASLPKVTVSGGFITEVIAATSADLPNHTGRHSSTTRTGAAPAGGEDPVYSYEVGAVERANPVVGSPLKITNDTDYTYADASNYFVVIDSDQNPNTTGPEGQIIFRKAT